MMEFRTPVQPLRHNGLITHDKPVVMLGSCFSDNIGGRLLDGMFDVDVNPFGTLYNPASIAAALVDVMECRRFEESDLISHNGCYHSFSHHSRFSGVDCGDVLEKINRRIDCAHRMLADASVLCVTFGTAFAYILESSGKVVSNCHKLPSSMFVRQAMTVDGITEMWLPLLERLRSFNDNLKIIFTVSPIRHLADGAHGNQLSKATLLLAVERLVATDSGNAIYFPAYEIMMDDLRDYRFYAADMTHPSDVAVEYIYSLFAQSFFNPATSALQQECEKLSRRLRHRPLTDNRDAIARFNDATGQMIDSLVHAHPYLQRAVDNILCDR